MKTIHQYLIEAGLSSEEIVASHAEDAYGWDIEIVAACVADYENPETAARRAKRTGPGVARAAKIHAARKAWLADQ